jgi:hypothetical protein
MKNSSRPFSGRKGELWAPAPVAFPPSFPLLFELAPHGFTGANNNNKLSQERKNLGCDVRK